MDDFRPILDIVDKLGTFGLAAIVAFAVNKKYLVLGREYDECQKQRDTYKALADSHAAKLESRLDKLESERDQRYARP